MRRFNLCKKRVFGRLVRTAVAGFLFIVMLATTFIGSVSRIQAQQGIAAEDLVAEVGPVAAATWLETVLSKITSVSTTISAAAQKTLGFKEFTLDSIAWAVAKFALQQMQRETVRWINSGFQGSPAFVQDLGGFLQSNADRLAGEFIYGSDLKALCSPFQLNIRIALSLKFLQKQPPARCTLSGVVGNVEDFLGGNFASGGLPGWFEVTVNPNNNFFGASASAESALLGKLGQKREIDLNKLLFGKQFLGKEECSITRMVTTSVDDGEGHISTQKHTQVCGSEADCKKISTPGSGSTINCKTITPGDTISASLNKALGTGQDALVTADEINEIISALFQQLAVQVLTGARGLLGTSEPGSDGTPSYLDQINNPQYDSFPGQSALGNDLILTAIEDEEDYRDLYAGVVAKADAILARIKELEALVANEDDDVIWECSSMEGVRARVTAIRTPAFEEQSVSDKNLATLNGLQERFITATQNASFSSVATEERLRIVESFITLQSGAVLHTETDIEEAKTLIEGLSFAGEPFGQQISGVPEPINTQLAELAAELEGLCHSKPKRAGDGDGDDE